MKNSTDKISEIKETVNNHYKFVVYVPVEDGKAYGKVTVDPYFVANLWGITDPSHFHILKTLCRFGKKSGNTKERETAAIMSALETGLAASQALRKSDELQSEERLEKLKSYIESVENEFYSSVDKTEGYEYEIL